MRFGLPIDMAGGQESRRISKNYLSNRQNNNINKTALILIKQRQPVFKVLS